MLSFELSFIQKNAYEFFSAKEDYEKKGDAIAEASNWEFSLDASESAQT